jgi:hypothetical protein
MQFVFESALKKWQNERIPIGAKSGNCELFQKVKLMLVFQSFTKDAEMTSSQGRQQLLAATV